MAAQHLGLSNMMPLRIGSPAPLSGQGFSPNASQMNVMVGDKPATVLAASDSELVLAPVSAQPGMQNIVVENRASGENASAQAMCYSLSGKLSQDKVPSGAQTMLTISVEPKSMQAQVSASIASGPVEFSGGNRQSTVAVHDGIGRIPLYSQPGSAGAFQVAFELVSYLNSDGSKTTWDKHDDGTSTLTEYDKNGRLSHEVEFDANGHCTDDTSWEYDGHGRCIKKVHIHWNADGGTTTETKTWDDHNRPTSTSKETRDSNGHQTSGTRSSTSYAGDSDHTGTTTSETYDPKTGSYK
jgi:hypothetical protein